MRIQVLPLPSNTLDDATHTPFALVVDQVSAAELDRACGPEVLCGPEHSAPDCEAFDGIRDFGREVGAQATLVTASTVEVVR